MDPQKEKENLVTFGYGLALIIPFIIALQAVKEHLNVLIVFLAFISILIIISKIYSNRILFFVSLLMVNMGVVVKGLYQGHSFLSIFFLLIAFAFFLLTYNNRLDLVRPIYDKWMKGAHFIGGIIFGTLLSVIFYVVFGSVGIFLRVIRKDLLNEKIEPHKKSYWIKKDLSESQNREGYNRQF